MSISIPARPRLYTRPFILMALANLFTVSSISAFFLFPLFLAQAGADKADIGLLMGAMALSSVLCRPYISQFIDRIGRKRGYLFGCLIMAGLPFSYLLFQGNVTEFYIPLILVRLLHGVGAALCFTSAFTYIADVVPEARLNEGVGMFGTTGLMAMALGPAVGEAVIRYFGFPAFFTTGAAFGGLGLILSLPLKESLVKNTSGSKATFFSVLWRPRIRTVGLLALLFGVGLAAYGSFVSPFAQALNIQMVSLYFIAYSFTAVLTRIFGGRLADRMGELRIVPYALSITGGGLGLLIFLNGPGLLILSGLITGIGHGFLFPCLSALALRGEPMEIRGKINGVFTGGIDGGVFAGSLALGFIGKMFGYRAIFGAAGLALLAGLLILRKLPEMKD
jgi:MFS family permease